MYKGHEEEDEEADNGAREGGRVTVHLPVQLRRLGWVLAFPTKGRRRRRGAG